jgi:Ankyrin repeats (3 copies)
MTEKLSDDQAEIFLHEEHRDYPQVSFLSRTYWAWLEGGLASLSKSTAQEKAKEQGLQSIVEGFLAADGFSPSFQACIEARTIGEDEWLVGFIQDGFLMTNRAIYVFADRKIPGIVEVILLDKLAKYFTKGIVRFRLFFEMRNGEVIKIGPVDSAPLEEVVDQFRHWGPLAEKNRKFNKKDRSPRSSSDAKGTAPPLVVAARQGRLPKVQRMLTEEEHLRSGPEALHAAAAAGRVSVVRTIIKAGVPVDAPDSQGSSALAVAGMKHDLPMVVALMDCKADPESVNENGQSAIDVIREAGHAFLASALLRASQDDMWKRIRSRLTALTDAEGVIEVKAESGWLAFPSTAGYSDLSKEIGHQVVRRGDPARLHKGDSFTSGVIDEALEWSTMELLAAKQGKLAPWYRPIASLATRGALFGALAGIALKLLDTTAAMVIVDSPMGLAMVLLILSFGIAKWMPIAPALAGAFAGITTGVGIFVAVLTAGAIGTVLGLPAGAMVGGLIGIRRGRGAKVAPDREPEGAADVIRWVIIPAILFAVLVYIYLWVFNPWVLARLEDSLTEG